VSGEHEREHIAARDVRPGDVVWNAYGGARGRAEVTSEARERTDGTIEFDCADGPYSGSENDEEGPRSGLLPAGCGGSCVRRPVGGRSLTW
jgi:hypothetical protein